MFVDTNNVIDAEWEEIPLEENKPTNPPKKVKQKWDTVRILALISDILFYSIWAVDIGWFVYRGIMRVITQGCYFCG